MALDVRVTVSGKVLDGGAQGVHASAPKPFDDPANQPDNAINDKAYDGSVDCTQQDNGFHTGQGRNGENRDG
jgi:hypothetical protein